MALVINKIADLNVPGLEIFHELSEPSLFHYFEPEPGVFIAESPMIIQRAVDAGYEPICVLVEDRSEDFIVKILEQSGIKRPVDTLDTKMDKRIPEQSGITELVDTTDTTRNKRIPEMPGIARLGEACGDAELPIYVAPLEELKKITGFHLTRGILCAMRRKRLPSVEDIICDARRVVILDSVMNPTNAGAIFRSAAALGMDAVLLTKGSADPLYRRAARVSMGTVFQIPWTFLDQWPEDITLLKRHGFTVAAMSLADDSVSLRDFKVSRDARIALVMGTEGPGLPKETIRRCDLSVRISMAHGVDSLNVAAASAVAFWSILSEGD